MQNQTIVYDTVFVLTVKGNRNKTCDMPNYTIIGPCNNLKKTVNIR